jgi:hypothetical protein
LTVRENEVQTTFLKPMETKMGANEEKEKGLSSIAAPNEISRVGTTPCKIAAIKGCALPGGRTFQVQRFR